MPLAICPACAKEISARAEACPHCGEPFKAVKTEPTTSPVTAGCTVLAVIGLIIWCVSLLNGPSISSVSSRSESPDADPSRVVIRPKARLLDHHLSYDGPTVAYGISRIGGAVTNESDGPLVVSIHYTLFSEFNEQGSVLGTASDYIGSLPGHTAWEFSVRVFQGGVKSVKLLEVRAR